MKKTEQKLSCEMRQQQKKTESIVEFLRRQKLRIWILWMQFLIITAKFQILKIGGKFKIDSISATAPSMAKNNGEISRYKNWREIQNWFNFWCSAICNKIMAKSPPTKIGGKFKNDSMFNKISPEFTSQNNSKSTLKGS